MPTLDHAAPDEDRLLFAKIGARLLPFLFFLYLVSYLDRVNVSFAGLQMTRDLKSHGFTDVVFGVGSGIFFLGYAIFEIPSNLIMEKVGARAWICRIMLTWGVISACMMFVVGPRSFYSLRLALGLAEAGFFPGMILYLTYWFPAARRARAVAMFMTATAIAGVIGAPVSGLLLKMEGIGHLHGWQWLFLAEGLPAVIVGFVVLYVLPNGPKDAKWLDPGERERIETLLAADHHSAGGGHSTDLRSAVTDRRVWLLTLIYFCIAVGLYCVSLWLPQIIRQAWPGHHSDTAISLVSGIPYSMAAIGMLLVGLHSDRTGERRWHCAGSLIFGAGGALAAALVSNHPLLTLAALCVAAMGIWGAFGPFWSMPSAFLGGTAAAGGIALINSIGCLGGFAGPALIGKLKHGHEGHDGFSRGLIMMAVVLAAGAIAVMFVRLKRAPVVSPPAPPSFGDAGVGGARVGEVLLPADRRP